MLPVQGWLEPRNSPSISGYVIYQGEPKVSLKKSGALLFIVQCFLQLQHCETLPVGGWLVHGSQGQFFLLVFLSGSFSHFFLFDLNFVL